MSCMKRVLPLFLLIAIASFGLSGCLGQSQEQKRANETLERLESLSTTPSPEVAEGKKLPAKEGNMDFSQHANAQKLIIEDTKVGTGAEAKLNSNVTVHYTGWLTDGTQFDTSHKGANQPITFPLVSGGLIEGWIQGVPGMKEGGTRRLIIPAELGYGAGGIPGAIPGNAVLVFDIELVKVQ